jgi:hypothetical protein
LCRPMLSFHPNHHRIRYIKSVISLRHRPVVGSLYSRKH